MVLSRLVKVLILTTLVIVLLVSMSKALPLSFAEPKFGQYTNDESIYLKTFYLVKGGGNYYSSLKFAFEHSAQKETLINQPSQWRLPAVTYLWSLTAKNAHDIFLLWWAFALLSILTTFLLVRKFSNSMIGLLSSLLITLYYSGIVTYKMGFLFTEWWSLFMLIFGVTAYVYNRKSLAWIFLVAALLIRELAVIPIGVMVLVSLVYKKDRLLFLSLPIVYLLMSLFHTYHVNLHSLTLASGFKLPATKIHLFDYRTLFKMLSFSMSSFPLINLRSHIFITLIAIILSIVALFSKLKDSKAVFVYLPIISMVLVFPWLNTTIFSDYWGIMFVPFLVLTLPLSLYFIFEYLSRRGLLPVKTNP